MSLGKLGVVIAGVIGFGFELVLHIYGWEQKAWGEEMRTAGHLTTWWMLSASTVFVLLIAIIWPTYLLLVNWLHLKDRPLLISTCIDLSGSLIFWFLGAVLSDGSVASQVAQAGLGHFNDILFSLGTIWAIVTFSRLAIVSIKVRNSLNT